MFSLNKKKEFANCGEMENGDSLNYNLLAYTGNTKEDPFTLNIYTILLTGMLEVSIQSSALNKSPSTWHLKRLLGLSLTFKKCSWENHLKI